MLEITYQKVTDLIPYVNNSRTHSDEQVKQIAASIKEFGFTNPVLIDEIPSKSTNMVTVTIDRKEKNMTFDSAVSVVTNEYNKRKLPTSKKNG